MALSLYFLVILACSSASLAIKVALMPQFGRSHYLVIEKLADELAGRGHEVSILVGMEAKYAIGKPNVKTFFIPQKDDDPNLKHINALTGGKLARETTIQSFLGLVDMQSDYCDSFLNSTAMMEEVKRSDILIGDSQYLCTSLVADKFNIPHIPITMSPLTTPANEAYWILNSPAYIPMIGSQLPLDMDFQGRLINMWYYFVNKWALYSYIHPTFKRLKDKYNISPEKTIYESLATADLVIMSRDYVLDYPQPLPPYVKEVGFFLTSPAKPLPADLEEFMKSSGDVGVILLSFGSMVQTLDENTTLTMMNAFGRIPQKIIAKFSPKNVPKGSIPPNFKAVEWLPQNDILGHVKTRLFITHAGANGLAEAAYHGVPMLCAPFFGDQFDNSQYAKDIGIAEIITIASTTEDELVNVLKTLLEEKRYKNSAARVSKIMKNRKRTPAHDAADLVEYTYAIGHLDHLKPRGMKLPFYQLYMLDVMAVLGTALVAVMTLVTYVLKRILRLIFKASAKKKAE